ncbi:hypothetical protein QBC38DRAFT_28365 [Podospora fimiseda]|uniref:Uncharacterized protein n=1 Tax=Podospora fimiseda TaxID=252190 RepID=A0AAN7H2U9_9PEZI|nr:hypothetical protein QBC38DRAFT_28365 [Podospora fimiseda]
MSALQSSGRGGAGNMRDNTKTSTNVEDLQTPTLKQASVITTGRGGSGNMAANLDDEEKRRRQDVAPVARQSNQGAVHIGRGGGGNVVVAEQEKAKATASPSRTPTPPQPAAAASEGNKLEKTSSGTSAREGSSEEQRSWTEKAKNLLSGKKQ